MKFDKSLGVAAFGEILGTAMLMLVGCTTCTTLLTRTLFEVAFGFGMAVAAAVQSFGIFSGAHINPSVTIANVCLGLMEWQMGIAYVLFQIFGALFGYGLFLLLLPQSITEGVCVTQVDRYVSLLQGIGYEFVLTGALVLFCCAVWDKRNAQQMDTVSLRFGFLILAMTIAGGRQTGASMNFARTLAPALWQWTFHDIWVYLVAQILASVAFAFFWKYLMSEGDGEGGAKAGSSNG